MRLKKDWRRYCIYRYDVIIAMATLYRYDVIFDIARCNMGFFCIASFVSDKMKYNDNIDVNNFQYFTRGGASSEMRLKIIDADIVFIANWSYSL